VPLGGAVAVSGCLLDYRLWEVIAGPDRGWAYAGNIVYPYRGMNGPLYSYGPMIGIGVIGFGVGAYWDQHYRHSAWYPQRDLWIHRPPPPGFGPGGRGPGGQGAGQGGRPPGGHGAGQLGKPAGGQGSGTQGPPPW
jgi:uncharacterized protein YraI